VKGKGREVARETREKPRKGEPREIARGTRGTTRKKGSKGIRFREAMVAVKGRDEKVLRKRRSAKKL
jgi:hypothetical protein